MSGKEYLEAIKANLEDGRNQHRMGQNLLGAFGYVRRRATAIAEINAALEELGLETDPSITSEMPLNTPHIIFKLRVASDTDASMAQASEDTDISEASDNFDAQLQDADGGDNINLPEPTFRVAELASANVAVECISPNASIKSAYGTMLLNNYSQLVVASGDKPMQQSIKGIVSLQSIAKALMIGQHETVNDCIDDDVYYADANTDLKEVVGQLEDKEVVLVIGIDKRLQGIITSWDLAEYFAKIAEPIKRIEETESRLRTLLEKQLGKQTVIEFLGSKRLLNDGSDNDSISDLNEFTLGELRSALENPEHWEHLSLPFDRKVFILALNEVCDYRNRFMHFREPLTEEERTKLTNFCNTVREIPL